MKFVTSLNRASPFDLSGLQTIFTRRGVSLKDMLPRTVARVVVGRHASR